MKFLLKLKPSTLLLLFWGPTIFLVALAILDIVRLPYNYYIIVLFIIPYAWNWSITLNLYPKLPHDIREQMGNFKLLLPLGFFFFCVSLLSLVHVDDVVKYYQLKSIESIIIVAVLLSMVFAFVFTFWGTSFSARVLKSAQTGRLSTYKDIQSEWVLILGSLLGVGIIQVMLNKLMEEDQSRGQFNSKEFTKTV